MKRVTMLMYGVIVHNQTVVRSAVKGSLRKQY
jgi:hypothetical protein